ncbi:hypothetical protein AVEN_145712-1 [Araneus ventricosus]|uniref:Uncharacterized protein n=1 Tax=Araneus ventricosus TaxID=182803 RepID=A0A4Y2PHQ5_ARAVE|nr:hypothetical protein AVEN_145712-1 [Araneus ventricosus]
MLYPETHEQCCRSVEERRPVERWHLLEIVELHTIATCQGRCLTSKSEKWSYNFIMHQGTPHVHLRGVTFVLNVGTRIFSRPYSVVMVRNMSTDMEWVHGARCCYVITCARTPLHYRHSLGYCPM